MCIRQVRHIMLHGTLDPIPEDCMQTLRALHIFWNHMQARPAYLKLRPACLKGANRLRIYATGAIAIGEVDPFTRIWTHSPRSLESIARVAAISTLPGMYSSVLRDMPTRAFIKEIVQIRTILGKCLIPPCSTIHVTCTPSCDMALDRSLLCLI